MRASIVFALLLSVIACDSPTEPRADGPCEPGSSDCRQITGHVVYWGQREHYVTSGDLSCFVDVPWNGGGIVDEDLQLGDWWRCDWDELPDQIGVPVNWNRLPPA